MAATTQLTRISGLAERLGVLASKQRGMRIEAEDWNTLVAVIGGILEVDRAQEQATAVKLEERFAPRTHDHLGQVTAAWLAPELQDRLGDGSGSGSVSTRTALVEANRKILSLASEVAQLTTALERQQKMLDQQDPERVRDALCRRGEPEDACDGARCQGRWSVRERDGGAEASREPLRRRGCAHRRGRPAR
jgi:hypothetical protein